ncbi:uncharacterized protein LOC124145232 [Haliotis rufescens]|uniref:uncharacterized protein LOC124145232 n=1 Tax=Haliotis rufescens TaxID=6454 RepID=UPI001EB091F8|nr:uncharacterized protein LOC124145232 [Haliotis rufescens]
MKRRKCVAMLVFSWAIVVVLTCIGMAEGLTTCLDDIVYQDGRINLNIALSELNGYNGNCSCKLQRVNIDSNVTITANDVTKMCEVGVLTISTWDICEQVQQGVTTWNLYLSVIEQKILLDVTDNKNQSVGGMISFTSLKTISLRCRGANVIIPETTTPKITTTPITTTTTEGPIEGTLLASAFGVFGGFVILLVPVFLCVRYRERRREKHNAKKANAEQSVQAVARENKDPEMLRYSWFKTLTIRIKRLYYGEPRRGRSRSRRRPAPTGSQAGRRFRKLFASRKGSPSSTSTNSLSASQGPDNNVPEVLNEEDNDDVFDVVSPQQGGGIFMDRCSFNEELMDVPEEASTSVDVHYDSLVPNQHAGDDNQHDVSDETVEGELVNSLFSGVGDDEDTEHSPGIGNLKVDVEGSIENNNGLTETQRKYLVGDEQVTAIPDSEVNQDKTNGTGILANGHPPDYVNAMYAVPIKPPKKANGTSHLRM